MKKEFPEQNSNKSRVDNYETRDLNGKNCTSPHSCEENNNNKRPNEKSTVFKHLLDDTNEQMVFDLNPRIEVTIRTLDDDVWVSYVQDPILMTGKFLFDL